MKKSLKKVLSVLMVGGLLSVMPVFKASASTFGTIVRAAQAMSVAQMEMNHIAERVNIKTQSQIPIPVEKPALTVFGVYSYIEHGTVHNDINETVHRSNLPLSILTYQEGFGNITGVSIDGVALNSALVTKVQFDGEDIDTNCAQLIVLDESVISALSTGSHTITVNCTGRYSATLVDYFSFNLVD